MILALIFLSLAVACRAISELALHGKLKWVEVVDILDHEKYYGFWDENSWKNKYKLPLIEAPKNWYYKTFNITYKERFPLSATALVFLTDGYHFCQFMFFNFLSLSITFALGFQWLTLGLVWTLIHILHATIYRLLSK